MRMCYRGKSTTAECCGRFGDRYSAGHAPTDRRLGAVGSRRVWERTGWQGTAAKGVPLL